MQAVNLVAVTGRLTRDPEIKSTPSGQSVAEMGIAVEERGKKDEATGEWSNPVSFFDVQAWGWLADLAGQKLRKGSFVTVQGRLKQDTWEKEGEKRSKVKIVAELMNSEAFFAAGTAPASATAAAGPPAAPADDDIPF